MVNWGEKIWMRKNSTNCVFEEEMGLYTFNMDQWFCWFASSGGQALYYCLPFDQKEYKKGSKGFN